MNSISDLYTRHRDKFAFRGNRPGESLQSKINELALIGDSYLYLEVRLALVNAGLNTSQIATSTSQHLSNYAMTNQAIALGLIPDSHVGVHAAGTLLEAVFGYWHMSARRRDSKALIYTPYQSAFRGHIKSVVQSCITEHRHGDLHDRLFS